MRFAVVLITVLLTGMIPVNGAAQGLTQPKNQILTIDSDRLFSESLFGQRVAREIEAEQSILLADNRRMEAELADEEQSLTDQRPQIDPTEFRKLAEAFDARVVQIRSERDAMSRKIGERRDREEAIFVQAARPVLGELLVESGAAVILEQRTILLSSTSIDITNEAIRRLNTAIGDGADLSLPNE